MDSDSDDEEIREFPNRKLYTIEEMDEELIEIRQDLLSISFNTKLTLDDQIRLKIKDIILS